MTWSKTVSGIPAPGCLLAAALPEKRIVRWRRETNFSREISVAVWLPHSRGYLAVNTAKTGIYKQGNGSRSCCVNRHAHIRQRMGIMLPIWLLFNNVADLVIV
jgi:hypothetical protein